MKEIYRNALSEVNTIIDNSEEDIISKIPTRFRSFIKNNMNKTYKVNIKSNMGILEQDISNEAKVIIALIYRDYICSKPKREEIIQQEIERMKKQEKLNEEKYSIKWKK